MQDKWTLDEPGLDWRQLWRIFSRRKWAILTLAAVVTLLTALIVYAMTPVYRATALVHIQSEQANIVSIEDVYGVDPRHQNYLNTQIEILRSRPVAARVVAELGVPATASHSGGFDWRSYLPFKAPEPPGGGINADPEQAQIDAYLSELSVTPVRGTQLVNVSYVSEDPAQAAKFANAHAQAYFDSVLDARLSVTQSASRWMDQRVEELRGNLQSSRAALQAFREQEKVIDAQGYQALSSREINDLSTRLVNARRKLSAARISYRQVNGNGASAIESVPAVLDNKAAQQFRAIQALAEQNVAELGKRYGPKHPKMIAARSELAEATENLEGQQRDVAGAIGVEYRAAQAEVNSLEAELAAAKDEYQALTRKGADLASLQQEVETNRELYELFYGRMRETAQTDDLKTVNARVVEPAVLPRWPIKPNKSLAIALAFGASLLAGFAAAILLERLNNTVRSSQDVESKLGFPLLGMVPLLTGRARKEASTALFDNHQRVFGEAIRTIRTGVSLSNVDHPHKVIQITSSLGSEGKSTVAMNLALAFAQVERVLLLDTDMRHPSVARNLGIDRTHAGLSELLARRATIKECITRLDKYSLDVLGTGAIPPDPLVLLSSDAVSQLMKVLRDSYDRIIVDSPPILPVSDSAMLSKHADALVYVIKSDATSVRQIKGGIRQLQRFDAPITGVVLNQLNVSKAERYDLYGGYGESYMPEPPAAGA